LNIYIAPLQENYSVAIPTPERLKRAVLRLEINAGDKALGKIRNREESPFIVTNTYNSVSFKFMLQHF